MQVLAPRVEPGSASYQRHRERRLDRSVHRAMVDPDEILTVVDADPIASEEPA